MLYKVLVKIARTDRGAVVILMLVLKPTYSKITPTE